MLPLVRSTWAFIGSIGISMVLTGCIDPAQRRVLARASEPSTLTVAPALTATLEASTPVAAAPVLTPFDADAIHLVLDDPRLAEAKALLQSGKPLDAARAVSRATVGDDTGEAPLFAYLEARLRSEGGDPKGAAAAFDRAALSASPLQPFALLASAEHLEALGDHAGALHRAESIVKGSVPKARLELVLARSSIHSGKLDDGFAHYRALVRERPRGWPALALELARSLMAHPGEGHALEALKLATDVELDAPSSKGADEAQKISASAQSNLSREERQAFDDAPELSPSARGRRLVASGKGKRALSLLDRLAKKNALDCVGLASHAEALSQVKRYSESSTEYGRAIEACEKAPEDEDLAVILFQAGRAAVKGGQLKVAQARYKRIEDSFATHRLADDARLEGARAALADGDGETFDRMLGSIADDYPEGDMRGDGLFTLGLSHAARGEWASALPAFERGARLPPERGYERAGRFGYYFGRALLATGRTEEGRAALAKVIREAPCSFYMALAYTRLGSADPNAAKKALEDAIAKGGAMPNGAPPELIASPAWKAAVLLIRADDPTNAEGALGLVGIADRSVSAEGLWAAARLLARATDPVPAHRLLRTAFESEPRPGRNELSSFRAVYPVGDARKAWEIAYPRPFAADVSRAASESGASEALLLAVMREESAFDPAALSKANAVGLLQLLPITARKMAGPMKLASNDAALRDPAINVRLGARYLASMRRYFSDDPLLAIPGYNAGRGGPDNWTKDEPSRDFDLFVEAIPYAETRAYTKRVLSSLCAYEIVYGNPDASEALHAPLAVRPGQ